MKWLATLLPLLLVGAGVSSAELAPSAELADWPYTEGRPVEGGIPPSERSIDTTSRGCGSPGPIGMGTRSAEAGIPIG